MAVAAALMTVEQFRALPESADRLELHHGEVFTMTKPKLKHWIVQDRLVQILKPLTREFGVAGMEVAFRPLPEHELWAADVAVVSRARRRVTDLDDNFHGAPEMVIEVLSPSNTVSEMNDREEMCLRNGCLEFWVVDPVLRTIKVSTPDGLTRRYYAGDEIPLRLFGDASLAVASVFEDLVA